MELKFSKSSTRRSRWRKKLGIAVRICASRRDWNFCLATILKAFTTGLAPLTYRRDASFLPTNLGNCELSE
jgi:hypothetical protein